MIRIPLPLSLVMSLGACAASEAARPPPASPHLAAQADMTRGREELRRIDELEARVALLEQEARAARTRSALPRETVRIGGRASSDEAPMDEADSQERPAVLRLVGNRHRVEEDWTPPSPPPGGHGTLAVVALPEARRGALIEELDRPASRAAPREAYRAALALVRERRFDEALATLTALVDGHPDHGLADDAMYWRGEVHYVQQRFADAAGELDGLLARFPDSNRVADALLKLGLCRQRLGDEAAARGYFGRVRREFPHTEAARLVPEEVGS